MGKRKQKRLRQSDRNDAKRAKISETIPDCEVVDHDQDAESLNYQIQQKDKVEKIVDIIVKNTEDNSHRSLTIWGKGLGIDKTIAVVEELKRNYVKNGVQYKQETSIETCDTNIPYLQVVLTLFKTSLPESNKLEQ